MGTDYLQRKTLERHILLQCWVTWEALTKHEGEQDEQSWKGRGGGKGGGGGGGGGFDWASTFLQSSYSTKNLVKNFEWVYRRGPCRNLLLLVPGI